MSKRPVVKEIIIKFENGKNFTLKPEEVSALFIGPKAVDDIMIPFYTKIAPGKTISNKEANKLYGKKVTKKVFEKHPSATSVTIDETMIRTVMDTANADDILPAIICKRPTCVYDTYPPEEEDPIIIG